MNHLDGAILEFPPGSAHFFLSNFYTHDLITVANLTGPSVEHVYQAAKTIYPSVREAILAAPTPGQAKKLGRNAPLCKNWDDIKNGVMLRAVRQKFQIPRLRKLLLSTGQRFLVEGNYWGDTYWGVCKGNGENHLGQILMKVRSEIREAENEQLQFGDSPISG